MVQRVRLWSAPWLSLVACLTSSRTLLQPNKNYKFRVKAKNSTGFGDPIRDVDKYSSLTQNTFGERIMFCRPDR